MDLNDVSRWFSAMGIHPVIGGALVGALAVLLFRFGRGGPLIQVAASTPPAWSESASTSPGQHSSLKITHNGATTELPPDTSAQISQLIRDKKNIDAIKLIRQHTGLQLKDAKDLADSLETAWRGR
ncbi:MAG: hypothetical protein U0821_17710 [Chloroflexota bacterium]